MDDDEIETMIRGLVEDHLAKDAALAIRVSLVERLKYSGSE
jgi:hypothetical protein